MNNPVDVLFQPFSVNNLQLANRVVMAPMTRNFSPDGLLGPEMVGYYRRRAENGCGLIITEGTAVECPVASGYRDIPLFYGDEALARWKQVVDEVHDAGGRIMPQIWHVGGQRNLRTAMNPELPSLTPSGFDGKHERRWEPATRAQIQGVIEAFARAARSARDLGFDGVEVHGAHGYLVDQFLWERTNQRTDEYGGSIENRVRFAAELIAAMRAVVGPDFPIVLRISQWKSIDYNAKLGANPQELERYLLPLVAAGVDMFDCSQRRFWEPEFDGSPLNFAGWVKKLSGRPTISVGSVGLTGDFMALMRKGEGSSVQEIGELLARLERQEFDLIAIGRALLADPAWVRKIREGRLEELAAFDPAALKQVY